MQKIEIFEENLMKGTILEESDENTYLFMLSKEGDRFLCSSEYDLHDLHRTFADFSGRDVGEAPSYIEFAGLCPR